MAPSSVAPAQAEPGSGAAAPSAGDPAALAARNTARVRRVLLVTLVLNLAVAGAKIAYGIAAGSLAIRADGLHSTTDALNNVALLVGVWFASRPPDDDHPYGHRKFELFAAGLIGVSLLLVAFDVARGVIARFLGTPHPPPDIDGLAFVVLGATLVVNVFVARYEARVARATDSPALQSDAAHTGSDVLVTAGVALSAILVKAGFIVADAVAGAGIAVVIALTGFRLLRANARFLVDHALVDPAVAERIAVAVEGVVAAADVRTRGMPGQIFMDLTIRVRPALTVQDAHALSHVVADRIRAAIAGVVDVHVHVEPAHAPPSVPPSAP